MTGAFEEGHAVVAGHRTCVRFSTSSIGIVTAFFSGPERFGGDTTRAFLRSRASRSASPPHNIHSTEAMIGAERFCVRVCMVGRSGMHEGEGQDFAGPWRGKNPGYHARKWRKLSACVRAAKPLALAWRTLAHIAIAP